MQTSLRDLNDALAHYRKAVELEPDNAAARASLANALRSGGEFHEAITHYRKALAIDGTNAAIHNNLGGAILCAQGSLDDAIACFEQALAIKPDYAEAHYNLGNVFRIQGQLDQAIAHYEQALAFQPGSADIHNTLAHALRDQGRLDNAIACFQRALALRPDGSDIHYHLGNVFSDQGKLTEALACYERALALRPDYADAHTNLIVTLMEQGRLDDALACCERALAFNPDSADAHLCEAHIRLLTGDFANGWREYEWRWGVKEAKPHALASPMWAGQPVPGKTILLHCEQGLGDSIQFVRYARFVRENCGRVMLSCPASLAPLFQGVQGIDEILHDGLNPPDYEFHSPLLSLPGLFRTTLDTIPDCVPYLQPDPARAKVWRERPGGHPGFKVGVAWRGSATNQNDRNRSLTAARFAEFLDIPGLLVVSLQKDGTAAEVKTLGEVRASFLNAAPLEEGLADAAALMTTLDLVISVDTSLCHLAGALGVPVWTLIPFTPDWRWLLEREDSPWYPTMRLFRQPKFGDWPSVLERLRTELIRLTTTFQRQDV